MFFLDQSINHHLLSFRFSLERFDCDNLKNIRQIIVENHDFENELEQYREIVSQIVEQRSTTRIYDILRFLPITNMFVEIFGI